MSCLLQIEVILLTLLVDGPLSRIPRCGCLVFLDCNMSDCDPSNYSACHTDVSEHKKVQIRQIIEVAKQ